MYDKIGENFMCYKIAKRMWEAVRILTQFEMDVTEYFNTLTKLWQEVDLFNSSQGFCVNCIGTYQKMVDKERIYDFFFFPGINKELDEVRGHLLGTKPLPTMEEVFAEVWREECCKSAMLGAVKPVGTPENSAFSACGSENFLGEIRNTKRNRNLWCDYCQRSNHNRDKCWKLQGKPENWKDTRNTRRYSRGFQATSDI